MGRKNSYDLGNRRVIVIHAASLLAPGVEMILKEHGLDVIGVDPREEDVTLLRNSLEARDIIIIDSSDLAVHPCLNTLQQLVQTSDVVIVCLNPGEGTMDIYRKEQRTLGKLRDLFEVMRYA